MIRGVTFDKQLNKSEDDAHRMHYFFQGQMGITKGCEISIDANGNLVVSDGYFDIFGRLVANVGDTIVEVPDVASGTLYSILVFEVDLSQENTVDTFNQGKFKIVSDSVDYPPLTQEDLDNGGTVYQMEFCRFENTVAGIVNLVDNRTILDLQMYAKQADFAAHLADDANPHGVTAARIGAVAKTGDTISGDLKFTSALYGLLWGIAANEAVGDLANFPDATTEEAIVRLFRHTNTSGNKKFRLMRGNGLNEVDLDIENGRFKVLDGQEVSISAGGSPEGNVTANIGSIHLRVTPSGGQGQLYVKESGSGNTGWVRK